MEEFPVCSDPAKDEGSLMSKENIFEDFEDVYDTKPWEDVPEKWAADGVIITTRKGKKGEKVKIDFSANLTAQFYTSQSTMDLCNSAEYATAMAQAALNDGLDPVAYASNYGLNLNASQGIGIQAYDLSVSNATDKYSALFSLGYKKNNGILKYTDFENFSGRVNTSFNVNKLVTVCDLLPKSPLAQAVGYAHNEYNAICDIFKKDVILLSTTIILRESRGTYRCRGETRYSLVRTKVQDGEQSYILSLSHASRMESICLNTLAMS